MELLGTADPDVVIQVARTWIGTRYHHQSHTKGVGCDCIGLIIGVWMDLFNNRVPKDFILPTYTPHWGDETGQFSAMADHASKYLIPVQDAVLQPLPGDICMWRMQRKGPTKHAGIIAYDNQMIHAYYGHDVMESAMINNVGARLTHLFRFPSDWTE